MNSAGELLRRTREAQGRSLDDIAVLTRISRTYLQQLEEGNVLNLPETYVRAFIRAYAQEVGLDAAELLKGAGGDKENEDTSRVGGESSGSFPDARASGESELRHRVARKSAEKHRQVDIFVFLSVVVVLGLAFSLIWLRKDRSSRSIQEISFAKVVREKEEQQKSDSVATGSFLSPENVTATGLSADSLVLDALASESSWVKVVADGVKGREYYLGPSNHIRFKSKSYFLLSLQNPHAVSFTLNGRKISALPTNRKPVYNITVSRDMLQKLPLNGSGSD